MASVNMAILLGRLGRDPETRVSSQGDSLICTFSLATSRFRRDANGQNAEEVEWHDIVCFGKTAEVASKWLRKGSQAHIVGRISTSTYTGKDGTEKRKTSIVCERIQLIDYKPKEGEQKSNPAPKRPADVDSDADIPF